MNDHDQGIIANFISRWLGANWKTSLTGIGTALTSGLVALSALPYTIGDLGNIIPPEYKAKLFTGSLIATVILRIWNSILQKDKNVSGGSLQQDVQENVARPQEPLPPPPNPALPVDSPQPKQP